MMAILRAVARIVRRMRQRHANRAANFAYLAHQPSTTYYEGRYCTSRTRRPEDRLC